jgi:tripartite-type tricarboxylate transporter receptor subunit TctC
LYDDHTNYRVSCCYGDESLYEKHLLLALIEPTNRNHPFAPQEISMTLQRRSILQSTAAALLAAPSLLFAQSWPTKAIRLVVPFPPGGLLDNMARLIAPRLTQVLGQTVVIDNKAGSGGNIGAAEAARAQPDGYTLLLASPPLTISPALYKNLPYKPEQIAPVALMGRVPNVLLVKSSSKITSVKELTDLAKAQPGKLNYGSNGNGTSLHLSAELYKSTSGIFITHIPYRGSAASMNALLAGEIDMMFDNVPPAMGQIQAGTVRALAVTSTQRSKALPNVPTMVEAGVPGFDVSAWFGLAAPAGTPAAVVSRLEQALEAVSKIPEVTEAMLRQGADPVYQDSRAMGSFMASDAAKWKRVAAYANITLD